MMIIGNPEHERACDIFMSHSEITMDDAGDEGELPKFTIPSSIIHEGAELTAKEIAIELKKIFGAIKCRVREEIKNDISTP